LSLVHADWFNYEGVWVIAFEDDASRKILATGEFSNATTENAINVLKNAKSVATDYNDKILAINTDRGSQFYASSGEKRRKGVSEFEQYLRNKGIQHILSRKNNP
jgi:transposase InsO family protein